MQRRRKSNRKVWFLYGFPARGWFRRGLCELWLGGYSCWCILLVLSSCVGSMWELSWWKFVMVTAMSPSTAWMVHQAGKCGCRWQLRPPGDSVDALLWAGICMTLTLLRRLSRLARGLRKSSRSFAQGSSRTSEKPEFEFERLCKLRSKRAKLSKCMMATSSPCVTPWPGPCTLCRNTPLSLVSPIALVSY